mmetsp:Transcript_47907/g.113848  ORF Transcript_47907/g.113848 Transcript_47907/m.113848 type:complete len:759 (+) Transcript_47907:174-2450(+)
MGWQAASLTSNGSERSNATVLASVFLATAPPLLLALLATSAITPVGEEFLQRCTDSEDFGFKLLTCGGLACFAAFILDLHCWMGKLKCFGYTIVAACTALLVCGWLTFSGRYPSIPLALAVACSAGVAIAMRRLVFPERRLSEYCLSCAGAMILHAILLLVLWVVYAFTPLFTQDYYVVGPIAKPPLQAFVLWASPLMLALLLLVCSAMLAVRAHFHFSTEQHKEDSHMVYLHGEAVMLVVGVLLVMICCWAAASVSARGSGIAGLILRIGVAFSCGLVLHAVLAIGPKTVAEAALKHSLFKELPFLLTSDWVKALAILFFWPLVPVFLLADCLHQMVRHFTVSAGLVEAPLDGIFTPSVRDGISKFLSWNRTSIISKAILCGLAYFTMSVLVSVGINLLLARLIELMSGMSFVMITVVLIAVGICIFLLPPVPGLPIYITAGVVFVGHQQAPEATAISFYEALAYACAVSLVIKLLGTFMQQKLIGVPFSRNVQVKKMIGVHTATMKAVRHVLSSPGLAFDKVCVLVTGPDWPTSVLTGVLDLPLLEMQLGTLPVIILIVPAVVAGAFMVRPSSTEEESQLYDAIASVALMLTVLLQSGSLLLFLLRIGSLTSDVQEAGALEASWEADPQEKEVLEAVEASDRLEAQYDALCRWENLPYCLQALLLLGGLSAGLMLHLVLWPFFTPFIKFNVVDKISSLPGGTAWGAITMQGWLAISLAAFSAVPYCSLQVWAMANQRLEAEGEATMLLGHTHHDKA